MKQEILPYIFCLPYSAFPFCFRPQQYSCNALCSFQLEKQLASYSTVIFTCLSHTDTDESYSSELNWSQRSTAQGYCLQPNATCIRQSPGSVSFGVRKSASPSLPPKCFGIGWVMMFGFICYVLIYCGGKYPFPTVSVKYAVTSVVSPGYIICSYSINWAAVKIISSVPGHCRKSPPLEARK